MKIGFRLGLGFAVLLLLMVVMSVTNLWQLQHIDDAKTAMFEAEHKATLAQEWLRGTAINATRTFALVRSNDPEDQKLLEKQMAAQSAQVSTIQKELENLIASERGKALISTVAEKRAAYIDLRKQILQMKSRGMEAEARQMTDARLMSAMDAYVDAVRSVLEYQKKLFEDAHERIDAVYNTSRTLIAAITLAALLIGAVLAWRIARSITRPLKEAVALANTVATGDLNLNIQVRSKDETGELLTALHAMTQSLRQTVLEMRSGSAAIATASSQVAAGNLDLSARTEQQASALEQTAASMEELTSTVRQNADNARQADTLAHTATDVATKGGQVVSSVVQTMAAINDCSGRIADIITVIDSIAFQTNILALNAAVEAARAGEQGRGFAVVAAEVRALAQRSAGAAKEIKSLIDDSVTQVNAGSKLVDQAGMTMEEIVNSVKRVTDIMAEIVAASHEQSSGIEQINQAITQMDQTTQQNAALVEEAAAASAAMREQADRLAKVASVFKLDGTTA
ncbi:methyl-accepting chemotaxis protein [Paucimonas lemoignei]|nr:methyl-accepting chemotaxis protein [Paucimonas lemoignei]